MSLSASHTSRFIHSRPTIECGKCGEQLLVPERSEYIDECSVRHFWVCEACDCAFETTTRMRCVSGNESEIVRGLREAH
jgi:hypothetical protein